MTGTRVRMANNGIYCVSGEDFDDFDSADAGGYLKMYMPSSTAAQPKTSAQNDVVGRMT